MNQVSVMFRKNDVINAGGYLDWHFNEDYYLWIRMYLNGFKFKNILKPSSKCELVRVCTNAGVALNIFLVNINCKNTCYQKTLFRFQDSS